MSPTPISDSWNCALNKCLLFQVTQVCNGFMSQKLTDKGSIEDEPIVSVRSSPFK